MSEIGALSITQSGPRETQRHTVGNTNALLNTSPPHHFDLVDTLRTESDARATLRVHVKGDNNKTADNAHVLLSYSTNECIVVMNTLVHSWELPSEVLQAFFERSGPRQGASSVFNECMPSYEHDWEDATFGVADYRKGFRSPKINQHPSHASNNDDGLSF